MLNTVQPTLHLNVNDFELLNHYFSLAPSNTPSAYNKNMFTTRKSLLRELYMPKILISYDVSDKQIEMKTALKEKEYSAS